MTFNFSQRFETSFIKVILVAKKAFDAYLINSAAHITGGGLISNIARSVPDNLCLNIDLSKIKTKNIFKWVKSNNISDKEMLKTFNCGVGFCLIVKKENIKKIKKYFSKTFAPYEIGHISKDVKKLNVYNKIRW